MSDDICRLGACALAGSIRDGSVSPSEAISAALDRISVVDPKLNAFAEVYGEDAMVEARAAETMLSRGAPVGPLHGVPVAIKDLTPIAGRRTTLGSHAFAENVGDRDPVIVRRLKAAGAIIVGKTTTPEFAHSSFTNSPLLGITRNPWNPERTSGGSSGGSAVAIATGCVALAEGTDMGGSVRIPAALSGCVGLKPSLGRIPMDILPTTFDTISHFGPLARSVPDAALFLSVSHGPDDADILSLPGRLTIEPDRISQARVDGLRIALSVDLGFYAVDTDVAKNTLRAAEILRGEGAEVVEVKLDWSRELVDAWTKIWGVFMAAAFGHVREQYSDRMTPALLDLMKLGDDLDAVTYRKLDEIRTRQWHSLATVFREHDALLCPTMAMPAPPVDLSDAHFDGVDAEGRFMGLDMTSVFNNVAPCPVLSVPSGFTADGLPTGAQIVGRRHDDLTVLRIGAALERALALPLTADLTPPLAKFVVRGCTGR